jgi:hypothetical protein
MKNLNYLLMGLFLVLAFTACKDNEEETSAFKPQTAAEFAGIRQNFLDGLTQTKIFDAATGLAFTSPKGVNVNIYGGLSVTGNVQLRYIELFDIGSLALANKPLMGRDYSNKVAPLVTGGEFLIEVTQNSKKLDGYAHLEVPVDYTQGADPTDMSPWIMEEDSTVWTQGGELGLGVDEIDGGNRGGNYYQCYLPFDWTNFDWTNIDWLYSLEGEKTEVRVIVPDGYNGTNSAVYAAFLKMPNTLAPFDVYVEDGKYFTEHTGIAPIDFEMFVIFVSGDALTGQFVYATKLVKIEANQYVTFTTADLHTGSVQQIIDAINGLY